MNNNGNILGGKNAHLHKERYDALDGLRALACIGIVLMHVKTNIAVKPTESFLMNNIIDFTGNFVLLFMMVSAFSLCCGYYERFHNGTINIADFYKRRYLRVLPFFALLVGIDVVKTFIEQGMLFTKTFVAEVWEAFADVTLVFGLLPDCDIEVVGVGWFLGVVFVFYMLFPFYTVLIGRKWIGWLAFTASIVWYYAVTIYFVPVKDVPAGNTNMLLVMPFFLIGGILYLYRKNIVELAKGVCVRYVLMTVIIAYTIYFFVCPDYRFTFANLLLYALWLAYAVAESIRNGKTLLNNKMMKSLSAVSMEVYLCHMMMFRIIEKLHLENRMENCDFVYWLTSLSVLASAIVFALAWKKIEKIIIRE